MAGGVFGDKGFIGTDYITTPVRKQKDRELYIREHAALVACEIVGVRVIYQVTRGRGEGRQKSLGQDRRPRRTARSCQGGQLLADVDAVAVGVGQHEAAQAVVRVAQALDDLHPV